jgi:hypothetical protein
MARWTAAAFSSAARWMRRALRGALSSLIFCSSIEEEVREAGNDLDADDVGSGKIGFHVLLGLIPNIEILVALPHG